MVRVMDMTVTNISSIFQLLPDSIYLQERDSGAAVFPLDDYFAHVDLSPGAIYLVEGQERASTVPAPTPPGGVAFQFPLGPQATQSRPPPPPPKKKYSRPIVVAQLLDGVVNVHSSVTNVAFTEDQANIETMATVVKAAMNIEGDVVLTDGSGRRILASPGTSGLEYWRRGARKVVAFPQELFELFWRNKRRRTSQDNFSEVHGAIEEFIQAAEALPSLAAEMREVGRGTINRQQMEVLRDTFRCLICRSEMEGPMLALCCRSLIGCGSCLNVLMTRNGVCPKCRAPIGGETTVAVAGLSEAMDVIRGP